MDLERLQANLWLSRLKWTAARRCTQEIVMRAVESLAALAGLQNAGQNQMALRRQVWPPPVLSHQLSLLPHRKAMRPVDTPATVVIRITKTLNVRHH